jgi:hypothetical protein
MLRARVCDHARMPTDLLDWVASERRRIVPGSWAVAVTALGVLCVWAAMEVEARPALGVVTWICLLLVYFGQHWLFVRRGRKEHTGPRPATLGNMALPVLVFTLQGTLSAFYVTTCLLHLIVSQEFLLDVQGVGWQARYAIVPIGLAVGGFASVRAMDRRRALQRLAGAQLVISWTAVVLMLSSYVGMYFGAPFYLQQLGAIGGPIHAVFALLLVHPSFAIGVYASVLRPDGISEGTPDAPGRSRADEELPSDGYLSSARALSFVLLVFTLLSFDVARSTAGRVSMLRDARDMFARQTARDLLAQLPEFTIADMPRESDWTSASEPIDFATYGEATVSTMVAATPMVPGVTGPEAQYAVVGGFGVLFKVDGGRAWRSRFQESREHVPGHEDPRDRVEFDDALPQDFARILRRVGLPVDERLEREGGEYVVELQTFAAVEEMLLRQPVSIPSVGLGVESKEAIWVLVVSVIVLLVLLRSRVNACVDRSSPALEQPWLILDARSTIERFAAGCWLVAIGLSAWVANGSLIALVVSEKYAEGAIAEVPGRTFAALCILTLVGVGGWLSATCVSQLLRLRGLRHAALSSHAR